jgi:hypothetical protein
MELYHHTDSAHLPWIIHEQALKASDNRVGGYPEDFLWATENPAGDPTATSAVAMRQGYRSGAVAAVRFTLSAHDFAPWAEVKGGWSAKHVAMLEGSVGKMGGSAREIAQWWCRVKPLPAVAWGAVEFRTWSNSRWRPTPLEVGRAAGGGLAVKLDGVVYGSAKQPSAPGRPTAYAVWRA